MYFNQYTVIYNIHTAFTFSFSSAGLMPCGANWCTLLILPEFGVTERDMGAMSTDTHYTDAEADCMG